MRRISAKHAKPGMVLARPVYDGRGFEVIERNTKINEKLLKTLDIHGVGEIIIDDWRVEDVPVMQLIAPELEGRATRALREIIVECQGTKSIDDMLLQEAEEPLLQMARELFPEVIGEVNVAGCHLLKDYQFVQPVKVVGMSLLIGRRLEMGMFDLASLGMAALFKDVGSIVLPPGIIDKPNPTEQELAEIKQHPLYSAEIVSQYERFSPEASEAIYYHHERWDGSGYPEGRKGKETCLGARILAIADSYYELVSKRPDRPAYIPNEAVEYIMAYSGELFDPEIVQIFARQVPLYPTGITVQLNTGELGIVANSNLGHIGRPVVRICFSDTGRALREPYDLNLTEQEHQGRLITQVIDY